MKTFFTIIKYDYLQRTRSYAFLITLCLSIALAYSFVPEPDANYYTIRIGDYQGVYNSAWFGYVTAIMSSMFLSLIGFYLINNSIHNDIKTKVGHIVAATSIRNFNYLFSKLISNFLVLMTIVVVIFLMSIFLFFIYNDGYPFILSDFIIPYFIITLPAMFFVSVLAIFFEVILGRYSVVQNIAFFALFMVVSVAVPKDEDFFSMDPLGTNIVIREMEENVTEISNADKIENMSIGYIIAERTQVKRFTFEGVSFPLTFIISRMLWMIGGMGLVSIVALFFHRFDLKERLSKERIEKKYATLPHNIFGKEILLSRLPQ